MIHIKLSLQQVIHLAGFSSALWSKQRQTGPWEHWGTPYYSENEETLLQPASRRSYDVWNPTRSKRKISLLTVNKGHVHGKQGLKRSISRVLLVWLVWWIHLNMTQVHWILCGGEHWHRGLSSWRDGQMDGRMDRWKLQRDRGNDGQCWPQQNP